MLWTVDFAPLNESPSEKEGKLPQVKAVKPT